MTELVEPVLVVGAGGAGARLASLAEIPGSERLQISTSAGDLDPGCGHVLVSTHGVINPSSQLIRRCVGMARGQILERISGYSSSIIMANLAGKDGSAISQAVARLCKEAGKKTLSFAIMPFRFEQDRIFNSGIALKRLREDSDCTIVADNDAVRDSNPNLTAAECRKITDSAILYVASSLYKTPVEGRTSIISAGRGAPDLEASLRDSLKMLYSASAGNTRHSILHVLGGDGVPAGILDKITGLVRGASGGQSRVDYASGPSGSSGIVMVSSLEGATRFDSYDPLGAIPRGDTLDWDEPECGVDCELELPQLE